MRASPAVALITLAAVAGCSTLRPVAEPAQYISEEHPDLVRVVNKQHGSVVMIAHPRVSGDSVIGTRAGEMHQVAVRLKDVHSVQAKRVSGGRTMLLLAGLAAAAGLTGYVISTSGEQHDWQCDYSTATLKANGGAPRCGPATP
jgi:hypothetical protein